ncbi:MAG TPA: tetratricopeptide repeat protein [Pyrinomonadaceae bacterium]|nr:tetratricopeptide repeat protein [Pyrinomonadaceae bacterium]
MHKRRLISLTLAVTLCAASSGSLLARGVVVYNETAHVEAAAAAADERASGVETADLSARADADATTAESKPKGNAFVRAITAPFRALGRLFGGGKRKGDAAKRRAGEKTSEAASAPTSDATEPKPSTTTNVVSVSQTTTAAPQTVRPMEVLSAPQSTATTPGVDASAQAARVEPETVAAQPGVRVVRPAAGVTTAEAARPRLWVPVIEGIPRDGLSQGRALLRHGYVAEAIAELTVASATGPDLVEANNLLGLALARTGQHKAAIAAYERALSVAPANVHVLNNLGHSLSLDNQHAAALKRLKQAARLAPGSPEVLSNMASVQARLGKYGDAFKSYARAFGEYQARVKTGELLEQAGRTAEAVKHYEAALKVEPNSAALLQCLAELYERAGRARDAEAARRRAGEQPNKQKTATGGGG